MNRFLTLLSCCCLMTLTAMGQDPMAVKTIDLSDLYRQIDEAIAQSPRYISEYEDKIFQAQ